MDLDGRLERSLRQGPPEEAGFDPRVLDLALPTDLEELPQVRRVRRPDGAATAGLRTGRAGGRTSLILVQGMALLLGAIVLAVGGFALGRATDSTGVPGAPGPTAPIQQPIVPDRAALAFAQANGRGLAPQWVVCPAEPSLSCGSIAPTYLDPGLAATKGAAQHGWPSAAVLWAGVKAVSVRGDHLVVVADAHPSVSIEPLLFALDGQAANPIDLSGVSAVPGIWYVDLGLLPAGRYVVVLNVDQSSNAALSAIGIVVATSTDANP